MELYGAPEEPPSFPVVLLDDLAVMYTTQFLPAPPRVGQHVLQRDNGLDDPSEILYCHY
ncbi:MAG: hypothetical protein L3J76_05620 [Candidatus Hydrothermae bacterium]|nr:hypothetical protein [Candidatus Hydrothermae bacterium]